MTEPTILLADNGSRRAESVLNLRRLANELSVASGHRVHPVSLQHADRIAPESLNGTPAHIFASFLRQRLEQGERRFLLLPLFFGPSGALSAFIPAQAATLEAEFGRFELQLAPVLCPLPEGEPRLASMLCDQLSVAEGGEPCGRVILVDHGSPEPAVTAVRHYLAGEMQARLGPDTEILQAVMERRQGADYDFNGELLEHQLIRLAEADDQAAVALSLLFLSPGRHAGPGGDIEAICAGVRQRHPGLRIVLSELVGSHPELTGILRDRLRTGMESAHTS
ncbi:MAG: CbiX/SirB N-terminal domain-containing protein [Candidatus Thiodiazotropha sp.]